MEEDFMENKLMPCPFCGAPARFTGECDMVWAECSNDDCRAVRICKFDEPEDAVEDWNQRITDIVVATDTANHVCRIDDIGRIFIPKEIRKRVGWTEGESLEIIVYPATGGLFIKSCLPY
jgi:AbrB family looped-hinge helix DNA binding protein